VRYGESSIKFRCCGHRELVFLLHRCFARSFHPLFSSCTADTSCDVAAPICQFLSDCTVANSYSCEPLPYTSVCQGLSPSSCAANVRLLLPPSLHFPSSSSSSFSSSFSSLLILPHSRAALGRPFVGALPPPCATLTRRSSLVTTTWHARGVPPVFPPRAATSPQRTAARPHVSGQSPQAVLPTTALGLTPRMSALSLLGAPGVMTWAFVTWPPLTLTPLSPVPSSPAPPNVRSTITAILRVRVLLFFDSFLLSLLFVCFCHFSSAPVSNPSHCSLCLRYHHL